MPKNTNTRKNKNTKNTKKSTKATKKVEEVVVEDVVETTPVETPVVTKQTGGKTKASKSTKSTKASKSTASKTTKKSTKKVEEPVVETETATATETQTGGSTRKRTFKAMLPGETEYSGRFTGSTPYQAASKAVTKYHKLHKNNKKEIKFSIKESTQGSKKNVGHYFGQRVKQQNPVSYEVSDNGNTRVISKDFKNVVKKIMKADLADIPENSYVVS